MYRQEQRRIIRGIKRIDALQNVSLLRMYLSTVSTIRNTNKKEKKYSGYVYNITDILIILVICAICGIQDVQTMIIFAKSPQGSKFFYEQYGIRLIPSYSQVLKILAIIDPKHLNEALASWYKWLTPADIGKIISLDGKTVRSTHKMKNIDPLHIVSAQISALGLTICQSAVDTKSNEIIAIRDVLEMINLKGNIIVTDALSTQTETVELITKKDGDYVLPVKGNQPTLYSEIENKMNIVKSIVDNNQDSEELDSKVNYEKIDEAKIVHGREETRTAYVYNNIDWLSVKDKWSGIKSIGLIETTFIENGEKTYFRRYYISSLNLTAKELINYTRAEWGVESMHWMLDVIYREDSCRLRDTNAQINLNMIRKAGLNIVTTHKNNINSKKNVRKLMHEFLFDTNRIVEIFENIGNIT